MEITDKISYITRQVIISEVKDEEFLLLTRKRYSFNWKTLKGKSAVYKLQIEGEDEILGVLAFDNYDTELRLEIKLLASSIENVGAAKRYTGVAGCLIAFTCRKSLEMYGAFACVSLVPKTKLRSHYIEMYGMKDGGRQLFLDGTVLQQLIKRFKA